MGRDVGLERSWRKRVREQERSGLTIRQFCQQEGLVDHQFSWWRGELKRRAGESRTANANKHRRKAAQPAPGKQAAKRSMKTAARFLPVQVEPSLVGPPAVEIILDRPLRIRVTSGFDAALLREVLRTVEQL